MQASQTNGGGDDFSAGMLGCEALEVNGAQCPFRFDSKIRTLGKIDIQSDTRYGRYTITFSWLNFGQQAAKFAVERNEVIGPLQTDTVDVQLFHRADNAESERKR